MVGEPRWTRDSGPPESLPSDAGEQGCARRAPHARNHDGSSWGTSRRGGTPRPRGSLRRSRTVRTHAQPSPRSSAEGSWRAGACWFFAKRRSITQHRVQQELWDRKFRLAEADREAAVSALNQNNVDVKRIKGTFESHVQRIAVLEGELKLERSQSGDLRQQLDQQAGAIETLRGERGEIETAAASSKAESERKTRVFKEAHLGAREPQRARRGAHQERGADRGSSRRAGRAAARRDRREGERAHRVGAPQQREPGSHEAALTGLEERILELEPLPAKLRAAEEAVEEWRGRHAALEEQARRDSAELIEEVELLRPLSAELERTRVDLDEARAALARAGKSHRDEMAALESAADEARAVLELRIAELEPFPGRLATAESSIAGAEVGS